MRALVTGGAGFIGSHLVRRLLRDGHEVVVLDDLTSGRRANIDGLPITFVHASVEDRGALRGALGGVTAVFHLAAMVSVPLSLSRPATCLHTNVVGTAAVLEEARSAGVEAVVFASSAAVYGELQQPVQLEEAVTHPTTPYGVSKRAGEQLCEVFDAPGCRAISLRLFNVYGPRQDPSSAHAMVVPALVARAWRGEDLPVFGDGEQTRDFIHVDDAVDAMVFAAETPSLRGVVNVGTGREVAINALAKLVIELCGSGSKIVHEPVRAGDVRRSVASVERLGEAGWSASIDLRAGLLRTIDAYR